MNYANELQPKSGYIHNTIRSEYAAEQSSQVGLGTVGGGPRDSRAIPQAANNLEKDLHMLGELINQLRNQLHPVMRPESPEVMKEESEKVNGVPMVNMLAMVTRQVRGFTGQVRDLIDRVEL